MGGAELDFREVDLPPGETEVFIICMMGGAEIIVPPDLAVDASGIAIMGGFEHAAPQRLRADAPCCA
jgi:predicted membrane protein